MHIIFNTLLLAGSGWIMGFAVCSLMNPATPECLRKAQRWYLFAGAALFTLGVALRFLIEGV